MTPLPLITSGQQDLGGGRIPFFARSVIGKNIAVFRSHIRGRQVESEFWCYQKKEHMSGGGEAIMKYKIARRQAGVVLMEVLPLLTLLGITGLVFVVYSTTGR